MAEPEITPTGLASVNVTEAPEAFKRRYGDCCACLLSDGSAGSQVQCCIKIRSASGDLMSMAPLLISPMRRTGAVMVFNSALLSSSVFDKSVATVPTSMAFAAQKLTELLPLIVPPVSAILPALKITLAALKAALLVIMPVDVLAGVAMLAFHPAPNVILPAVLRLLFSVMLPFGPPFRIARVGCSGYYPIGVAGSISEEFSIGKCIRAGKCQ